MCKFVHPISFTFLGQLHCSLRLSNKDSSCKGVSFSFVSVAMDCLSRDCHYFYHLKEKQKHDIDHIKKFMWALTQVS